MRTNLAYLEAPTLGIAPSIGVPDVAAALAFHRRAFAAEIVMRTLAADGHLAHCQAVINGGLIVVTEAAAALHGLALHLQVDDADRWWKRAVDAGCTVVQPLSIQLGGGYRGQLRDPFGVSWSIGATRRRSAFLYNVG